MARIKFGAIVTDMRGPLGGHVFQKGNQSRVMKTKTRPRVSSSSLSRDKTLRISSVQQAWNNLSDSVRLDWGLAAINFPFKSTFDDSITLNGYQFFIKLNTSRVFVNQAIVTSPSGINNNVPRSVITSATLNTALGQITTDGTNTAGTIRFFEMALKLSKGSDKVNPKKFVQYASSGAFVTGDSGRYTGLENAIGPISVGDIIYIGVINVNPFGFRNALSYVQATIT